ncbi:MAG TPA: TonB-dependent receptor [Geobacteraceae bacterium]|nr:TonB-dependent receptor [Geobacteraceae bacterium]
MRKRQAVLLGSIAIFTFSSFAFADEKPGKEGYEAYSLGDVYVKEGKLSAAQETTLTNVITDEDIKATNSRTVADALAHVPGMAVSTGAKGQSNEYIHGFFDQSRILIMVDGVPYYETYFGYLDLSQFPIDNVAKIEVIKGAASVLYGTNAEGGVINIITKSAAGKPYLSINGEGGQVDYYKASVSQGMKTGIFNYWLNYEHKQEHGWRMSDDFQPVVGTIVNKPGPTTKGVFEDGGTRNQSDFHQDNFWGRFGITPTPDSEYFVNLYYLSKDNGIPPHIYSVNVFPTRPAFSNFFRYNRYDDWGMDLSGQQKVADKITLSAKAFYHNHVDGMTSYSDQNFNNATSMSNYYDYTAGGTLIAQYQPVQWDTVRLAFNYRGDSQKQRADLYLPFMHFFSWTGSTGIENELHAGKNFTTVVGLSYDWFKVTEATQNNTNTTTGAFINQSNLQTGSAQDTFNPMIGATYAFPDSTKLFASVARKTRFPNLRQLFDSKAGNINLQPETAINSTIGVKRSFADFMYGELAFFYHDITDMIIQETAGPHQPFTNLGEAVIYGVEAITEFYPLPDLTVKLAYNYNNGSDQSDNRVTDNLINVPEHKLDMGVTYIVPYTRTRLDLNGILLSGIYTQLPTPTSPTQQTQRVGGYFTVDARVTQPFLKHYEAYIAFNNICDRYYQEQYGFPAPGRNIFGGITAKF